MHKYYQDGNVKFKILDTMDVHKLIIVLKKHKEVTSSSGKNRLKLYKYLREHKIRFISTFDSFCGHYTYVKGFWEGKCTTNKFIKLIDKGRIDVNEVKNCISDYYSSDVGDSRIAGFLDKHQSYYKRQEYIYEMLDRGLDIHGHELSCFYCIKVKSQTKTIRILSVFIQDKLVTMNGKDVYFHF